MQELCKKGSEILNNKSHLVQEATNELIELLLDVGLEQKRKLGTVESLILSSK